MLGKNDFSTNNIKMDLPSELWLLMAALARDSDVVRTIRVLNKWLYDEFKHHEKRLKVKTLVMFEAACEKPRMYTVLPNGVFHGTYVSIFRSGHVSMLVKKHFYWGCLDGLAMCKEIKDYGKDTFVGLKYCPYKNGKRHGMCYEKKSHDFGLDLRIEQYESDALLYSETYSDLDHTSLFVFGRTVMRIPCYEDDLEYYPYWHGYADVSFDDFF